MPLITMKKYLLILFVLAAEGFTVQTASAQGKLLIHYWNFSQVPTSGSTILTGQAVPANYSAIGGGTIAYVNMPGFSSLSVFDNATGDPLNARLSSVAGSGMKARNPCATAAGVPTMQFVWTLPTTGYSNILITYASQSSSAGAGQTYQNYDYSTDGGVTFTTTNLPVLQWSTPQLPASSPPFGLATVDLSGISAVNNCPGFVFRIIFGGSATTVPPYLNINGGSGNNRFDNIAVEGDVYYVAPPSTPTVSSLSHVSGVWSTVPAVSTSWTAATSSYTTIAGYSYVWDHSPSTVPDKIVETVGLSAITSLSGSGVWYFHVSSVDAAGTVSAPATFVVNLDTTNPGAPVYVPSLSQPRWSKTGIITANVNAVDAQSGVASYKWTWDASPTASVLTNSGTSSAIVSPALGDGTNWMLHIAAVDNVGNVGPTADTGPFGVDRTPPPAPTFSALSVAPQTWTNNDVISVQWRGTDALNGIAAYAVKWDNQSATIPIQAYYQELSSTITSPHLAPGRSWYLHFAVFDSAYNMSSAVHLGPFYIDNVAPHAPSITYASVASGIWSSAMTDTLRWDLEPSDTANVHNLLGYATQWSHSPSLDADTIVNTTGNEMDADLAEGIWYFHVRAVDAAHNWSPTAHYGPIYVDHSGPTGTLIIGEGETKTTSLKITLALSAVDALSGVALVQFSNDGHSWTSPQPFISTLRNWDLEAFGGRTDTGRKTVYVRLIDSVGNANILTQHITYAPAHIAVGVNNPNALPGSQELITYPNPASAQMVLSFDDATQPRTISARLFDACGRLVRDWSDAFVRNGSSASAAVDVSKLNAGIYMLQYNTGGNLHSRMIGVVR